MLSRVAERVYWIGRYLERADNTARLATVYHNLLLDLPINVSLGWDMLIRVTGNEETFTEHYRQSSERNVIRFFLADERNPSSIRSSFRWARENVRTCREVLPSEAWALVNELFVFVRDHAGESIARRERLRFLDRVMARCQRLRGLLLDNMSHDTGFEFLQLGRNLERADMSSRIIDTGALTIDHLGSDENLPPSVQGLLWVAILKSLSAYQMYRQTVRRRINRRDVLQYLFLDEHFPRTIRFCLSEIAGSLANLPRSDETTRGVMRVMRMVREQSLSDIAGADLSSFIDALQVELDELHRGIAATWFEVGAA
ncbi:MAG: alpha-E domain-containing protein [Arenicellales bacterium]